MNINQDFILRNIYGKHILMPIRKNDISSQPILLNDVAAYIWENASKQVDKKSILDKIVEHYSLKKDSAEQFSVETFIDHMIHMKLIVESEECYYV